jgi:cytochrome P450 family 6
MEIHRTETLRLFPPIATYHRVVTHDYKLDNGEILKAGVGVLISALGFFRDEAFFLDPLKFDPDRFSAEAKAKRHPFHYFPFGAGPRLCIGQRFAQSNDST